MYVHTVDVGLRVAHMLTQNDEKLRIRFQFGVGYNGYVAMCAFVLQLGLLLAVGRMAEHAIPPMQNWESATA